MESFLWRLLICSRSVIKPGRHRQFLFLIGLSSLYRGLTAHRCFLPSFGSFGQAVSEERILNLISFRFNNKHGRHSQFLFLIGRFLKIFSSETARPNEPILGRMDRDEMSNLYRGPSINASYQVSVHLAKQFHTFWSVNKYGRLRQFLFLIGRFLKKSLLLWNRFPEWTEIW
jgi:hypothetical protein